MAFCKALDEMTDNTLRDPFADPCHIFSGNFAPVNELPPTCCPVIYGSIATCLVGGAYIGNGPNLQYLSDRNNHIFYGDGMLHSLLLSAEGHATLCSRYVRTHKYMLEHDAGCPTILGLFSSFHGFQGLARGYYIDWSD
jgi:9-cis-epoxycarotenoid dioxygenase